MTTSLGVFFTMLGYVVAAFVFYLEARRRGLATEGMRYVALAGLVGGVLGAKLTQWGLVHWQILANHPEAFLDPTVGGRTIIGGVLVGWAAVEVAKRRLSIRRRTGDLFALALAAGEAIGRIGCFFNTCCYGTVCTLPWAVYQHGAWRHPTQLYSSVVAAGILVLLMAVRDRMPREGDLFRVYLVLFGVSRFWLEFVRERDIVLGGLSMAQWVCLEIVVVASLALLASGRRARALSLQRA